MKKQYIVCVDDEQIVLDSLKNEISRHFGKRLRMEAAESGKEALEAISFLESRGHEVVIVISDYLMPGMKGDELLAEIHRSQPDIKKILLTGEVNLEGVTNAINSAGLYRYISKPWEFNDLMMTLEGALESFERDRELKLKNEELQKLNTNLERLVKERTEQLERKNEQVKASIRYARHIQRAVLPHNDIISNLPVEHFVFYRPRDVVSGDFYFIAEINQKAFYAVVDCTGHGVPGAFMSLIGDNLLNQAIFEQHLHSPDDILMSMNMGMQKVWKSEDTSIHEGMEAAVCVLDFEKQTLCYAGAKNPLLAFVDGKMNVIKGSRAGIDASETTDKVFEKHTLPLSQVSEFYIYSDGFQDQFGGSNDKKFGRQRLRSLTEELHGFSVNTQSERVTQTFDTWKGSFSQTDDVLLMGVKIQQQQS